MGLEVEKLKFSVIIPVYNVEEYLIQCVESVINQSFSNNEIILIDDGSTDNSGLICDDLASQDKRIIVIHQNNKGLSQARNVGIVNSSGDYLLFLDSDDYWSNDCFLRMLNEYIMRNPVDVVNYNFKKEINGKYTRPYFRSKCKEGNEIFVKENRIWIACAWNKAVKASLFQQSNLLFKPGCTAEDVDWCARLLLCASSYSFLNVCTVVYRFRSGSITNTVDNTKRRWLLRHIEDIGTILKSDELDQDKKEMMQEYLAYQIGVMLLNIKAVKENETRNLFYDDLSPWLSVMKGSKNPKLVSLFWLNRIQRLIK